MVWTSNHLGSANRMAMPLGCVCMRFSQNGMVRVSTNTLINHSLLEKLFVNELWEVQDIVTGSLEMGSTLRELEPNPNILWFSHLNFYLNFWTCIHLWSSLEPLRLSHEIHCKLLITVFTKTTAQAAAEFWTWAFCSQGIILKRFNTL